MKLLEGLVLLAAVILFAWWQWRDVSAAQRESARKRETQSGEPQPDPPRGSE